VRAVKQVARRCAPFSAPPRLFTEMPITTRARPHEPAWNWGTAAKERSKQVARRSRAATKLNSGWRRSFELRLRSVTKLNQGLRHAA
jgi:hypothetical protein